MQRSRPAAPMVIPAQSPRSAGAIIRGLGAMLLLLGLIVIPPAALVTFVGNPVPDQIVIGGQFTDAAVIGLLAVIVWVAWAHLVYVIAVETAAAVRGVGVPRRIPFAGPQQQLARRLVTAVLVLLTATASITTSQVLGADGRSSPAAAVPAVLDPTTQDRPVAHEESGPHAELRTPVPTTTGAVDAPAAERTALAEDLKVCVVQPPRGHYHDTLWDIAEQHLGDGLRWKEIFELNRHRPQPDGGRLELARLIQPGWRLLMPADAVGLPPATPPPTAEAPGRRTTEGKGAATAPSVGAPAPQTSAAAVAQPSASQDTGEEQGEIASRAGGHADVDVDHDRDSNEVAVASGQLVLGLGIIAAAALVGELERRRRRQQRHRLPGQRLTHPEGATAQTEQILRTANREITIATLTDALRELAGECRRRSRSLPDVHAIRVSQSLIELILGADDPDAVPPFSNRGPRTWTLARPPAEPDADVLNPYPALVTVGVADDAVVLVNLEAAGTLNIVGPAVETGPVLHALVAELGTSALMASVTGGLVGCPPQLAQLVDQARLCPLKSSSEAASWAAARLRNVSRVLAAAGVRDLAEARARDLAGDVWVPEILVFSTPPEDPVVAAPYSGLCVVGTNESPGEGDGWVLRHTDSGRWHLDPLGLDLSPQRLDAALLGRLGDLLVAPAPPPPGDGSDSTAPESDHERSRQEALGLPQINAALPTAPDERAQQPVQGGPRILVLGPVEVLGVGDMSEPGRRRRGIELLAYLVLHPGASQHQIDEALWPGNRVSRNTRNPLVSRTRHWLGRTPDGEPYLPLVGEVGDYGLRPEVTCDWHDFVRLAHQALAQAPEGTDDLVRALELVRGRPFVGIDPASYSWAEADTQDMISTVVDVAHALAELSMSAGEYRRARWAAAKGLLAEPCSELLYRDAIRAAALAGDADDAETLAAALRTQIERTDPDGGVEDETAQLLVTLGQVRRG